MSTLDLRLLRRRTVCSIATLCLAALVSALVAPAAANASPTDAYIRRVYSDFLFRPPSEDEVTWWTTYLRSGSRQAMVQSLLVGDEFRIYWLAGIQAHYLGFFDSLDPEFDGRISALATSSDYVASEASVIGSQPYWLAAGATNQGFVTAVYRDVLLRDPDPSGLSYWVGRLDAGSTARASVAESMIRSGEAAARRVAGPAAPGSLCSSTTLEDDSSLTAGSYCIILDRPADPSGATYWSNALAGSSQLPSLWASLAGSAEYFNGAQ